MLGWNVPHPWDVFGLLAIIVAVGPILAYLHKEKAKAEEKAPSDNEENAESQDEHPTQKVKGPIIPWFPWGLALTLPHLTMYFIVLLIGPSWLPYKTNFMVDRIQNENVTVALVVTLMFIVVYLTRRHLGRDQNLLKEGGWLVVLLALHTAGFLAFAQLVSKIPSI